MRRNAVDLDALSRGRLAVSLQDQLIGYVGATGREYILDESDFRVLARAGAGDWQDAAEVAADGGVGPNVVEALVEYGFLESDRTDARPARAVALWDEDALYFHQRMKWQGEDADLPAVTEDEQVSREVSEAYFEALTAGQGAIPPHFHARGPGHSRVALELDDYRSPLTGLLARRHTTRRFDTGASLAATAVSTVLRHVFGCHGIARLSQHVTALKKSSPSGGAMHPVEVYPLVLKVAGLAPGLYHYHVGDHALEPLRELGEAAGRELARRLAAGQAYFAQAHVVLLYTARFERGYWKYRRNPRAYRVAQLDLGHLSQTLYLMCADLGLGAFFTAACNEVDIEEALDIDGIGEGALAVGGFGIPLAGAPNGLQAEPYEPGRDRD